MKRFNGCHEKRLKLNLILTSTKEHHHKVQESSDGKKAVQI